jgi:hypothetical protein
MKSLYFWFETSMAGDSQRIVRLLQNLTEHTYHQEATVFSLLLSLNTWGQNNKVKLRFLLTYVGETKAKLGLKPASLQPQLQVGGGGQT